MSSSARKSTAGYNDIPLNKPCDENHPWYDLRNEARVCPARIIVNSVFYEF
jgi:hypothetical protein